MRRTLPRAIRLSAIMFSVAILASFVQPGSALAAAPAPGLSKLVAVGTSTYGTAQNATDGSSLRYLLTYSNSGSADAMPLTITDTLNAGQSLSFYSPGCTNSDPSLGLVTVTCTVADVPPATSGTIIIGTIVTSSYSGTITNTASASAPTSTPNPNPPPSTLSATATSNTVTVSVAGPPPPNPGFTLLKFVSVNGGVSGASADANVGDTLTYTLQFSNNTGMTLSAVTLSDALAPGQAFVSSPYSSNSCANYSASTSTVSCTLLNVPPGTFSVYIQAAVQNGVSTIANQATATVGGSTVVSNATSVTVGQPARTFAGSFNICGVVTSYVPPSTTTSGSLGFYGQSYVFAAGATVSGGPITIGENTCFTFTTNTSGQIVAVSVTPNLTGVNVVCGIYGTSSTANTILVNGSPYGVNGTFVSLLVPGSYYCFVVNSSGVVYILLTNIPTGITAPNPLRTPHRLNVERPV